MDNVKYQFHKFLTIELINFHLIEIKTNKRHLQSNSKCSLEQLINELCPYGSILVCENLVNQCVKIKDNLKIKVYVQFYRILTFFVV